MFIVCQAAGPALASRESRFRREEIHEYNAPSLHTRARPVMQAQPVHTSQKKLKSAFWLTKLTDAADVVAAAAAVVCVAAVVCAACVVCVASVVCVADAATDVAATVFSVAAAALHCAVRVVSSARCPLTIQ